MDSKMRMGDMGFEAEIHALSDEAELRAALEVLDVTRADETDAEVGQIFE